MKQRIQVLMVEDDADYTLLMTLRLNEISGPGLSFAMECADTLKAGLELLAARDFDVVLLDLMLPDSQGLETLSSLLPRARGIPIVVMTNLDEEDVGLEAVADGAQDFLSKGRLDARLVKRTIGYALERSYWVQRIENLIANCPDGMVVVDAGGTVRYVNPAGEGLFGRKTEEMVGNPFGFPVDVKEGAELRVAGPDGAEKVLDMRVTEVEWRSYPATLACLRDITELRRIEQMKAEIKEQRRIDQLKEAFLNAVSHELRSPLTVVKAVVANFRDRLCGPLPETYDHMVTLASRNLERLARIINNLLDISRLESGQAKVNPQPVDIAGLIREMAQGIDMADHAKGKRLKVELPAELPPAHADPDMLAQVLNNLIDNGLRYAASEVVLSARAVAPAQVQVSVGDDGPGIPPDRIGDLFNKFVQIKRPAGVNGYKGTGLGLAICRETLKLNGGRIWVESEPGRGTRFHFVVPEHVPGGWR